MTEGGGLCDMEFSDNESDDPLPQSGTGKSLKRLPTSEDISSDEESITGKKPPLKKLTVITPLPLPCPTPSPSPSPVPSPVPSPAPLPVPSPVPSPVPKHSTSVPRVRTYPAIASSVGPWIVFFRTKPNGKSLNVVQIMTDLRRYASVSEIAKVRPDKLRVVVGDRKHANLIVIDEHFIREYRVYIPCSEVEIQGVVTESSLNCETIKKDGYGIFKKLPSVMVDIVDCCQLGTVSNQQGKNVFTTSDSFRVTFSGSALPDYVVIDKLRLPVRLFVPKPMTCDKCKSVGHTAAYCSNKARCSTCGNRHEGKPCTAPEPKCPYCGGTPHELSACNAYTKNRDKLKRTLKERSKRSFAEILKSVSPPDPPPIVSGNAFAILPDEEVVADSTNAGTPFVLEGKHRRKNPTTPVVQEQVASVQASTTTDKKATSKEKKNQNPPGFQRGGSPPKPAPKSPTAPASSTSQTTLFKFSDIVDGIFTFFDVSDSTRTIIAAILPVVKALLHQLLQKWPLLAMIISLDD